MSFSSIVSSVYHGLIQNLYGKPKALIDLFRHNDCFLAEGYYPELGTGSKRNALLYQIKQVLKYGFRDDYYYMYGLDVKSKAEQKEYLHYVPFQIRRDNLNYKNNAHNSTCILRNKLYFDVVAHSLGLTTPKILAYTSRRSLYVFSEGAFKKANVEELLCFDGNRLFCKEIEGECGMGIFVLEIRDNHFFVGGKSIPSQVLEDKLIESDYLLQEIVTQHPAMSALYDGSINTMRLVTVRGLKDEKVHVMPSMLRIGANGSYVDNTSQGGIAVGFDTNTGQLHEWGFFKPQFGRKVNSHPNSGIVFKDFYIPNIEKAREDAIRFHEFLTDVHSIGWDIAMGPNGPVFIEGNDNWEINGPQVGNHGLRKEFEEYFYK